MNSTLINIAWLGTALFFITKAIDKRANVETMDPHVVAAIAFSIATFVSVIFVFAVIPSIFHNHEANLSDDEHDKNNLAAASALNPIGFLVIGTIACFQRSCVEPSE